ncbi:MAG: SCO family protein [Aggregatilineales bacterium]
MTEKTMPVQKSVNMRQMFMVFVGSMLVSGVLIFVLVSQFVTLPETPSYTDIVIQSEGGVRTIVPPRPLMDFTLPSHTGEALSLSSLQGDYTLLYFGYTHCPDVCLMTLNDLRKVRDHLGEDADALNYVFVSVDGERDTPAQITRYFATRRASDFILGLSGDETTLQRIGVDYDLFYQLNDDADQNANYSVDHTARIYLINPQQELSAIFAYGTDPEAIADYIKELIPST